MKKLIPLTLLYAGLMMAAGASQVFTGVITDTMCGADHKAMGAANDAKCVRDCVKMDKRFKYALYDGKNVYTLSDQATPEKFAAAKVKVTGALSGKTIQVEKIEAVK
ncbi:hypothetical protein [uncultured Paludibaculum sp.]|uniref:hypothetical protein n=1 Tax=uncultured Paludibaculum sp. TaxID=1765020 RepID=UPI002AAC0E2B|nr:hypothetical protein [uncultured Paludibaculum sp.]